MTQSNLLAALASRFQSYLEDAWEEMVRSYYGMTIEALKEQAQTDWLAADVLKLKQAGISFQQVKEHVEDQQ